MWEREERGVRWFRKKVMGIVESNKMFSFMV